MDTDSSSTTPSTEEKTSAATPTTSAATNTKTTFKSIINSAVKIATSDSVKNTLKSANNIAKAAGKTAVKYTNKMATPTPPGNLRPTSTATPLIDLTQETKKTTFVEKPLEPYAVRISNNHRITRWTYFGAMLRLTAITAVAFFAIVLIAGLFSAFGMKKATLDIITMVLAAPALIYVVIMGIVLTVRRLHDAGHSAKIVIAHVAAVILFCILYFGVLGKATKSSTLAIGGLLCLLCLIIVQVLSVIIVWFLSKDSEKCSNAYGLSPKYEAVQATQAQAYTFIQIQNHSEQHRQATTFCLLMLLSVVPQSSAAFLVITTTIAKGLNIAITQAFDTYKDSPRHHSYRSYDSYDSYRY